MYETGQIVIDLFFQLSLSLLPFQSTKSYDYLGRVEYD
jgi:hypothetical protein